MNQKKIEVLNPFDLKAIAEVPQVDWPTIDAYLTQAHQLFKNRKAWLPKHQRIAILTKTAELMKAKAEELAFQIANEGGKPLVDARVEVARAIDGVGLCVREL